MNRARRTLPVMRHLINGRLLFSCVPVYWYLHFQHRPRGGIIRGQYGEIAALQCP